MPITLQALYDSSPVAVQNVMASLSGYHRNMSRYGREYWQHREWLGQFDTWPVDRKLEFQRLELVRFVKAAAKDSDFYRGLYADANLGSFKSLEDLRDLPEVDKEMLRANMSAVSTVPRRGAIIGQTGGTTGKSLVVLMTTSDQMRRMALLDHFKQVAGFEHRRMRRATFNGKHIVPPNSRRDRYWRYNAACKQMMYSTFHMTEDRLGSYVAHLNEFQPHALDGFFTSMVDIANFVERTGAELTFRPVAIFPTAETVTESGRELLERVFNAKVYNQYASSEGAPFITECPAGSLHVRVDSGVFEDGGDGEVLVTSFTTHGTPLIRYRIGDSMMFHEDFECACGVQSPQMKAVVGRNDDFLFRADGARVNGGNVANLFKNMPNALIRAQAVQREMDHVLIQLEVAPGLYGERHDELLRQEFLHKFGPSTRLTIQHVDEIPREQSGKQRLIRNLVSLEGI